MHCIPHLKATKRKISRANRGKPHGRTRIPDSTVRSIRNMLRTTSPADIAVELGVSRSYISRIKRRKLRRAVK